MLWLLGVRIGRSRAFVYLVLATVFIVWGFLINVIAAAVGLTELFLVGSFIVGVGGVCGFLALYTASRTPPR
jgi:hypothetical protein